MRKQNLILIGTFFFALCLSIPAAAQKGLSGTWEWKSRPNKNKEQVYFSIDIKQKAGTVSGRYWFNLITDGEGDDASFVPFIGTVKGNLITIEFDPADIRGIDDENTRYKKNRSPAAATLLMRDGKLEWTVTKGKVYAGDLNIPRQMILSRSQ
jgi:hypothetical protein